MPETGIEPVRPLFTKRRILSPLCLPISPLGPKTNVGLLSNKKASHYRGGLEQNFDGGAARSRTGLAGFAIRYITALLPRHVLSACVNRTTLLPVGFTKYPNEKGQLFEELPFKLEREKSLELSTSTLARLRSTN